MFVGTPSQLDKPGILTRAVKSRSEVASAIVAVTTTPPTPTTPTTPTLPSCEHSLLAEF